MKRNRSAACGAWREQDGTHAHTFCTGAVSLPPPDDRCTCPCHDDDAHRDGDDPDGDERYRDADDWRTRHRRTFGALAIF